MVGGNTLLSNLGFFEPKSIPGIAETGEREVLRLVVGEQVAVVFDGLAFHLGVSRDERLERTVEIAVFKLNPCVEAVEQFALSVSEFAHQFAECLIERLPVGVGLVEPRDLDGHNLRIGANGAGQQSIRAGSVSLGVAGDACDGFEGKIARTEGRYSARVSRFFLRDNRRQNAGVPGGRVVWGGAPCAPERCGGEEPLQRP